MITQVGKGWPLAFWNSLIYDVAELLSSAFPFFPRDFIPFHVSVVILESLRCPFPLSQQSHLRLQLHLSYLTYFQPVHSLTAPSHALAIFSEENWEWLHSCAVLTVGLESKIAELLGGGLHVSGLVYISSQLVHPTLRAASILSIFHVYDSVFVSCKIVYQMVF